MIALDRLQQIIPKDLAVANKALSVSLQQVSKLPTIQLKELAGTTSTLRTCSDLPLVNQLTQPVPQEAVDFFNSDVAVGSGPNGTLQIVDFFGLIAGITGLNYLAITNTITTMDVTVLESIYTTMRATVNKQYGAGPVVIPAGSPGAGTYSTIDDAINTGLIPLAKSAINNLISLYPSQTSLMNYKWKNSQDQMTTELTLQKQAGIDYALLTPENRSTMMSWIQNLPSQGLDLTPGGNHWFIQSLADMNTLAGQSIIGCLRQGVNQYTMNKAGVNSATNIPVNSAPAITKSQETGKGGSAAPGPK